eukprot:CAMPEP_0203826094 /NCGR_PEP_ID=MMETSP0115-20131106/55894_1 /ASSEMBLY_ACC=CAM_ASM_000227 /TAXON_ID=33651 /ORGANISM="Bicosoecid sp, Strain ms1" /LENGTH=511 /DNA_ID=CAMNT_0050735139 /DNA_START=1 /DNA_END=1536 /DNA_ORIENTATION=-
MSSAGGKTASGFAASGAGREAAPRAALTKKTAAGTPATASTGRRPALAHASGPLFHHSMVSDRGSAAKHLRLRLKAGAAVDEAVAARLHARFEAISGRRLVKSVRAAARSRVEGGASATAATTTASARMSSVALGMRSKAGAKKGVQGGGRRQVRNEKNGASARFVAAHARSASVGQEAANAARGRSSLVIDHALEGENDVVAFSTGGGRRRRAGAAAATAGSTPTVGVVPPPRPRRRTSTGGSAALPAGKRLGKPPTAMVAAVGVLLRSLGEGCEHPADGGNDAAAAATSGDRAAAAGGQEGRQRWAPAMSLLRRLCELAASGRHPQPLTNTRVEVLDCALALLDWRERQRLWQQVGARGVHEEAIRCFELPVTLWSARDFLSNKQWSADAVGKDARRARLALLGGQQGFADLDGGCGPDDAKLPVSSTAREVWPEIRRVEGASGSARPRWTRFRGQWARMLQQRPAEASTADTRHGSAPTPAQPTRAGTVVGSRDVAAIGRGAGSGADK